MNGANQQLAGNRFVQIRLTTDLPGFLTMRFAFKRGDKDDGNFCAHFAQVPAKIESGHAAQLDVEHQTIDRFAAALPQEGFGRMVNRRPETGRAQQTSDGASEAFVVIHHRDRDFIFIHRKRSLVV